MIKQAILSGELGAGQPLPEVALAKWCGVSRTPVREALRRLEQDGLAERSPHGLAVRERSPEEIIDLYDTRVVLEAFAGQVAAQRRTDHDIRLLRWNLDHSAAVPDTDEAGMMEANQQFHEAVWRASHNESLTDLLQRLSLHLARYPGTTLSSPGRWDKARAEHAGLVDAIEDRDGDAAYEIARGHFLAARDIRLDLFARETSAQRR
jgi:DNA-binding GntR family transcriptional regulator